MLVQKSSDLSKWRIFDQKKVELLNDRDCVSRSKIRIYGQFVLICISVRRPFAWLVLVGFTIKLHCFICLQSFETMQIRPPRFSFSDSRLKLAFFGLAFVKQTWKMACISEFINFEISQHAEKRGCSMRTALHLSTVIVRKRQSKLSIGF